MNDVKLRLVGQTDVDSVTNPPTLLLTHPLFSCIGDRYYQFSASTNNVSEMGQIRSKFKPGARGSVPTSVDTAFYNFLDQNILFFKGERVSL